jgi:hypothetical protein
MMAQPEFGMSPVIGAGRKPKTSIYVIMLVMSLVALLMGMLFLYLEIRRLGGFGTVRGQVSAVQPVTLEDGLRMLRC